MGVIYLRTAYSNLDNTSEDWVYSSWPTAFVLGPESSHRESQLHRNGVHPGTDTREKLLESRESTLRLSGPCQGLEPLGYMSLGYMNSSSQSEPQEVVLGDRGTPKPHDLPTAPQNGAESGCKA